MQTVPETKRGRTSSVFCARFVCALVMLYCAGQTFGQSSRSVYNGGAFPSSQFSNGQSSSGQCQHGACAQCAQANARSARGRQAAPSHFSSSRSAITGRPLVSDPREEMARLTAAVSGIPPQEEPSPKIPSLSQMVWEQQNGQPPHGGNCQNCSVGGFPESACSSCGGYRYDGPYYGGLWLGDWPAINRFALHVDRLVFRKPIDFPRNIGRGDPFTNTSWLNRPYHAGWFMGTMWGDGLISGELKQNNDFFAGYRLGWDFDHYWGVETRFAFAQLNVKDAATGQRLSDTNDVFLADIDLLYYPWGDSRWRPYLLAGLGFGHFHFQDASAVYHNATLFAMPIGLGVKYQYRHWIAARLELLDNIAFANDGLETMHNVSLTLGVEIHWGVHPRSYWPWHPSRHIR